MRLHPISFNLRTAATGLAVAVAIALTGCGNTTVADKVLGDSAERDRPAVQATLKDLRDYVDGEVAYNASLDDNKLKVTRTALDRMSAALTRAQSHLDEIESTTFTGLYQPFVTALATDMRATDRWLAYYEDTDSAPNKQLQKRLEARLEKSKAAVEAAGQQFKAQMIKVLPESERDEAQEMFTRNAEEYDERNK